MDIVDSNVWLRIQSWLIFVKGARSSCLLHDQNLFEIRIIIVREAAALLSLLESTRLNGRILHALPPLISMDRYFLLCENLNALS